MFSTVSSPAEPNAHQLYKTLLDYDKKLRKRIKSLFNRCSNYLIPRASQLALRVSALVHSYAGRHVKAIAVKAYYSCLRKKFRVRFLLRHFSMHKIGFNQDVKAKGGRWTRKTKFHSNVLLPRVRP